MASGGPGGSASVQEKLPDTFKEVELDVTDNEQGRDTRSTKIGDSKNTAEEGVDKGGKSNQDSTIRETPIDLDQTTRHQITQRENDENDSGERNQDVGSKSNGDGGDEKQNSGDSQHDIETKWYKELKEEQRQEGLEDNITSKQSRFVGSNKKQNDNEDKVLGQFGSVNDPNSDGKEKDENQPHTIDADQEGTNNTGDIPDENGVQYKNQELHSKGDGSVDDSRPNTASISNQELTSNIAVQNEVTVCLDENNQTNKTDDNQKEQPDKECAENCDSNSFKGNKLKRKDDDKNKNDEQPGIKNVLIAGQTQPRKDGTDDNSGQESDSETEEPNIKCKESEIKDKQLKDDNQGDDIEKQTESCIRKHKIDNQYDEQSFVKSAASKEDPLSELSSNLHTGSNMDTEMMQHEERGTASGPALKSEHQFGYEINTDTDTTEDNRKRSSSISSFVIIDPDEPNNDNSDLNDEAQSFNHKDPDGYKNRIEKDDQFSEKDDQQIEKDDQQIEKDGQEIENDNQGIENGNQGTDNQRIEKDGQGIENSNQGIQNNNQGIEQNNQGIEKDGQGVKNDKQGIENDSQGIENDNQGIDNQGIEKDGQGIENDNQGTDNQGIEKDGQGIEKDGQGIEKDCQGIKNDNQEIVKDDQGINDGQGIKDDQLIEKNEKRIENNYQGFDKDEKDGKGIELVGQGFENKDQGIENKGQGIETDNKIIEKEYQGFEKDEKNSDEIEQVGQGIENKGQGIENDDQGIKKDDPGLKKDEKDGKDNKRIHKDDQGLEKDETYGKGIEQVGQGFENKDQGFENKGQGFENKGQGFETDDQGIETDDKIIEKDYQGFEKDEKNGDGIEQVGQEIENRGQGIENDEKGIKNDEQGLKKDENDKKDDKRIQNDDEGLEKDEKYGKGIEQVGQGFENNDQGIENNDQGIENKGQGFENNDQGIENNYQGIENNDQEIENDDSGLKKDEKYGKVMEQVDQGIENKGQGIENDEKDDQGFGQVGQEVEIQGENDQGIEKDEKDDQGNEKDDFLNTNTGSKGKDDLVELFENLSIGEESKNDSDEEDHRKYPLTFKSANPEFTEQLHIGNKGIGDKSPKSYHKTSSAWRIKESVTRIEKENDKSSRPNNASGTSTVEDIHPKTENIGKTYSNAHKFRNSPSEIQSNRVNEEQNESSDHAYQAEGLMVDRNQISVASNDFKSHTVEDRTLNVEPQDVRRRHEIEPTYVQLLHQFMSLQESDKKQFLSSIREHFSNELKHFMAECLTQSQEETSIFSSQDKQRLESGHQSSDDSDISDTDQQHYQQSQPSSGNLDRGHQSSDDSDISDTDQQYYQQSQPPSGNGAHGYYTRSKSQEGKMDASLNDPSNDPEDRCVQEKGNGSLSITVSKRSETNQGKESQQDVENQKTTYQVQLSFENQDLLLKIPCLQKEYYQWTFIVEKEHAEFVNSLGKYPGFKRIKKDYQDKYLTLVCENNTDPEDLKEKIKSLFKEYSNTINAVYQVDIPDPQKVCEVAAKKIGNCKKGNVKVYPWEMNGLWIVGYGQHAYAVTKEIHDLIQNRSTKGFDTTEPSSKIDSSSCRTQETKRDKTQPQLNKPSNDRIENIIDRVETETIEHFGIINNILKKYPGMNITVTHNKIVFEGLSANVNLAYSDFKEELTAIKGSETNVSLSARCANMLHSKKVLSFIQHEIKPIHLLKMISDDQWVIYGQTKKDAKSVVKRLSDLVLQKEIQIDPIYWKSEEMVSEIHKLEHLYGEKLKLYVDNDDKKRNYIVATKDIMPKVSTALEEKKKCLTKKCVKHVDSSDHSSHDFLEKQMSHKLSDLRSRYNVNICSVSRNGKIGWEVEGSDLNVRLSIEQLEILKKSIKKESVKFESGKAVRFLDSKPGSNFLKTVEDALHCLIETESESYEEAVYGAVTSKIECKEYRHWIYKTTNRMIRLVCGNGESCGTELLVDVVSGSNKPGKGITYKPGQSKSAEVELPVPIWIDGKHKEKDTFCTMLNELFESMVERGCKTVAFPFDINYKVRWKNTKFVKLVIFEWNKFLSQKQSVLHCIFFHPEPDRCIIAESAIDEKLKNEIDRGSVLRSGSNEVNSLTSTKLNNGAGGEYMYPIQVVLGELAVQQVDIIVNTTSKELSLATGHVSASILRMGGQTIQDECDRYKKHNFHGISYGDFVETNGCGQLKCKKVYHCALSAYKTNGIPNLEKIMKGCLEKADKSNMASISFPAFGTGNLGFPGEISAECMFKYAEGFFDAKGITNTSVKDVRFVIYHKDQPTIQAFQREEEKRRNVSNFRMSVASNLTLYVATGEISNYETDALIVFWSGNEVYNNVVPREYLQKIGQSFTVEWNKKRLNIHSQKYIETSAGTLPFKKIFHQVIDDSSESKMSSGILFALKKAESSFMKSVCVALLRTDPLARLTEKYAKAFNGALKGFQSQRSKTSRFRFVRIVINDGNIYNKFRTEVQRETVVKPTTSSKATDKTRDFKKKKTIVHVSVTSDTEKDIDSAFKKIEMKISSLEDTSNEEQKAYPGKAVPNTGHDKADKKHTDGDKKADSRTEEKQLFLPSQVPKQRVQLIKTELESCRLLVYIKDDNTNLKDPTTIKMELMQTFMQKKAVLVVYPFEDNRSCLLKFKSPEDAEYCLTSWKNPVSPYEIKPFPPQVMVNIQAEISPDILHKIEQNGCFDKFKVIEQESGAELKNFGSCYLLEGSFVDIEIANEIIGSWINDETNRNDIEYLDVTSSHLKQDYISNVEQRNSETLSSNPGTEKIECTLDHFNILEKLIPVAIDMPSERTKRNNCLPLVPQQETNQTAYPYHVTEKMKEHVVEYVFHISKTLTVRIFTGETTKAPTLAIVSTEDKIFSGQSEIAKCLLRYAGSNYGRHHKKLQTIIHSELDIEETDAGDFHFVTVYHVVIPTPKQNMNKTDEERYFNIINSAVQSVLIRAQSDGVSSIAMDLIGKGNTFGLVSEDHCVSCCTSAIMDFSKQHQESKPLEIFIINLNESITNKFKCAFLDMIERHHRQSPSLQLKEKKMQSRETSDEDEKYYKQATYPYGTMAIEVNSTPRLKGHEDFNTIILKVFFPDGKYEGKTFRGLSRDFYLPDSPNGKKALKLLQNAFEQNKLFRFGYRKERSEFGVTYSGIHLKTNIDGGKEKYGYPDQKYLDRLKEELASVGVFEDKVEKSGQIQETSV